MALKFGPQWLRDLSDAGATNSQPSTPPVGVKFKLADYRYGREEMLSLFNESSPPLDQVQKHLSILSKEIQKPVTMLPLTEDEQRLVSQGFNSAVVLRAAGRGSGPPLRASRGGATVDRGRGRGRGRGEGYILRTENGEVGFNRPAQDGWEHVGRKFERSFSRGYDETGPTKREFSRSSSDNWRDKKHDDEEEEEGGVAWRNTREAGTRWGNNTTRSNWREPQRELIGFDNDRRTLPPRRGFDQDSQTTRRISESYDNEGEVPEWVEDDAGDDPGTFDSSGAFVSTKEGKKYSDTRHEAGDEANEKKSVTHRPPSRPQDHHPNTPENLGSNNNNNNNNNDRVANTQTSSSSKKPAQNIPANSSHNGTGEGGDSRPPADLLSKPSSSSVKGQLETFNTISVTSATKGDGDTGFAFPAKEEINGTAAPPGQYLEPAASVSLTKQTTTAQKSETVSRSRLTDPNILHMEKSLQNLVASMSVDGRDGRALDVSQGALPLTHENANKWFYKDPQGEIQGPFTNEEMSQWFSAGFFTMSLAIKRGCDDSFKQLGELMKRYNRVPFLPGGPPLPPLITSITCEPSIAPAPVLSLPSLVSSTPPSQLVGPSLPPGPDPLILQYMILQQEYLKQTFLMRQMQIQTLHQMQEQESFKSLSPEQQQHLSMQILMQSNPVFVQNLQQLQQQQLLVQQQLLQEQQKASPVNVPSESSGVPFPHQPNQPSTAMSALASNINPSQGEKSEEDSSAWGSVQQYLLPGGVWSQTQTSSQPLPQPASLWDIDTTSETLSPAYLAQLDKLKREMKENKLKEDGKIFQEELEKKQEEIRRQQEELNRQKMQMRKEMEELEQQKQFELQKIEETRRAEEERIRQEIERQQLEKQAEEKRRIEEDKRRQEEEKRREHELKKQEEKMRKEEEKRREAEEKRIQADIRRKREEEILRQQELQQQREVEIQRQQEMQRQIQEAHQRLQREEEERMQREASERERQEAQKRQLLELQRQQESMKRLQMAQKDQLANIQLPAASNWAAQQQNIPGSVNQSRSLTEIQEEEARQEIERERELQQMQKFQEQVQVKTQQQQQQQQKSWATHMSQGAPVRGLSLLDIQQQEQEDARRSQKEKPNTQSYQAKLSLNSASTWSGPAAAGVSWNSQSIWSASTTSATWDQVPYPSTRKTAVKESGEFPALKIQASKKNVDKSSKPKGAGAKHKKEEESVQKLFQNRQQDDFSQWVTEHVTQFCAPIDVPTFVSFIVEVDSPDDVREYMKTYLGDTREAKDFARQFVEKRNYFRNQARLERQQEEDSIWGPAPAVNPHHLARSGAGGSNTTGSTIDSSDIGAGKNKNRKKKQKMQKLDGSILGFTVHADPNRKNAAGEVESIH